MRILKRTLETKRSFIVMRRLRIPLRKKVAKIRLKKAGIVANCFEEYCSANIIFKMMHKWHCSILLIQRCFSRALNRRHFVLAVALKQRNRLEKLAITEAKPP